MKKNLFELTLFAFLKPKIIIGIMLIGIVLIGKWTLGEQKDVVLNAYKINCENIWCVQSIVVNNNNVLLEFPKSYHGVDCRRKDGVEFEVDKAKPLYLEIDDTIECYGDHEFEYLTLKAIKDNVAFIEVKEKYRPPGEDLYSISYKCKIYKRYPGLPIQK